MTISINLGSRTITQKSKPYIIAEIGVNHEGSMQQAKRLIELAREGGADAAKFQSYKANTLASKNSPAYWDTNKEPTLSQHQLFQKYDNFEPNDYIILAEHCKKIGIDFLSTPFDDDAIDFLDPLVPFFKIASADLTNTPFLRKVAKKGKPILLSTGASTLGEIDIALEAIRGEGCTDVVLLHCILNYPTLDENAHLRMIEGLRRAYPEQILGYSDHTLPDELMTSLVSAYLLGAPILEKHFTHDKNLPGNDHYHAMDVMDLKRFVDITNKINILLGESSHKKPILTETVSRKNARRSIVVAKKLDAGHIITSNDITYKRPGTGISPIYWDMVVGKTMNKPVDDDHILSWADFF